MRIKGLEPCANASESRSMKKTVFHGMVLSLLLLAPASLAQEGIPLRGPDYIRDTISLSRALGSAHAIRVRCNGRSDQYWRIYMQDFLELEAPQRGSLRSSLVDGFNSSYQNASARYLICDGLAVEAEQRYAAEGKTLADRLARHYFPKQRPGSSYEYDNDLYQDEYEDYQDRAPG